MDYEDLLGLVRKRRSIRRFKPDPIPEGCIEKIIEVARWAMSGANAQPWEFVAIKSPEIKKQVCDLYCEWMQMVDAFEKTRVPELRLELNADVIRRQGAPFKEASVIIAVLGDPRTLQATVQAAHILNPDHRTFHANCANATHLIHLAAASLGLGSQWVSVPAEYEARVKAILGVPEVFRAPVLVPIGYPAYEPAPSYRREVSEILHIDKFDMSRYRSVEDVLEYVASLRRRRRGPEAARERAPEVSSG